MEKKYNQRLISELSKGEICTVFDSKIDKVEDLNGVMEHASGKQCSYQGYWKYYFIKNGSLDCSLSCPPGLPVIPLSQFLLPEFQEGDEVEVSENGTKYQVREYAFTDKKGIHYFRNAYDRGVLRSWPHIRPLSPKPEVILTMQELTARLLAIEEQVKIKKG